MRLRHPDGTVVHLAYCTNVHPAEDLDGVLRQLSEYAEPVREQLHTDRLGLGLWLARDAAQALAADSRTTARLGAELAARGLEVVTLNGFPYRGFHEPVVKHAVYAPDWTRPERLAHTLDLARILAALLPDDAARGSLSTLPLAWREPWNPARRDTALRHLDALARQLACLHAESGREIRVGLEPEPGCVVATVADACAALAGQVDPRYVGVCVDTCHLAVDFEEPAAALDRLAESALPVVKAQLSCALQADDPSAGPVRERLTEFAEPRFLHQTRRASDGALTRWDDLDTALAKTAVDTDTDTNGPWRVHFHVPLHADPAPPLTSTRPVLTEAVETLVAGPHPLTDHLEVETYTWSALPPADRPDGPAALVDGITAELSWTRELLCSLGLKEDDR